MSRESKPCLHCGKMMHFKECYGVTDRTWANRKCCSITCAAFYRHRNNQRVEKIIHDELADTPARVKGDRYTLHYRPEEAVTIDTSSPVFAFLSGRSLVGRDKGE
ncbi:MAG: hypothetical protein ACXWTU_00455 [Methylotenera sp.]